MAKKPETYFGLTGAQAAIGIVVLAIIATMAGFGPLASDDTTPPATNTTTPTASFATSTSVQPLQLDSVFSSTKAGATVLADADNNYNDDTNIASLQFDTSLTVNGTTDTTFKLATINSAGSTITLLDWTETGVLTAPAADNTTTITTAIDLSVLEGFADTQQVHYGSVSASANSLTDTTGTKFYPIVVKTTDTTKPAVKINTVLDTKSYSWLVSSDSRTVNVTFDISWTGINKMQDISDKIIVPITIEGGDDSPIKVEFIRNAAIL